MEELGESLERLCRNLKLILAFDHTRDKVRDEIVISVKGKYPFVEIQIPISRNKTMTNANSLVVGWISKRYLRAGGFESSLQLFSSANRLSDTKEVFLTA